MILLYWAPALISLICIGLFLWADSDLPTIPVSAYLSPLMAFIPFLNILIVLLGLYMLLDQIKLDTPVKNIFYRKPKNESNPSDPNGSGKL